MTKNRLSMVIAVLAMVVVALGGFFLGVQPKLAQAAADGAQQATIDTQNAAKTTELERLRERAKTLPDLQEELATLTAAVPGTASMSSFYASVDDVAGRTGVTVSAITTSDAVAYSPPAAAAPSGSSDDTPTSATTASPSSSATGAPTPPPVTTDPAITAANFSAVPVTVSVDGDFAQALAFVSGMQDAPRLFLVNAITSSTADSATDDGAPAATTWTFGGYVYVLADTGSGDDTESGAATASDAAANG